MFARFAIVCCLALLTASSALAQWKTAEPPVSSAHESAVRDAAADDEKFRPSPLLRTVQLPAPVDSIATGPVTPVTLNIASPAVRGQEAAQLQSSIVQSLQASQGLQAGRTTAAAATAAQAPAPTTLFQPSSGNPLAASAAQPTAAVQPATHFTSGNGTLPNQHGQVWREYDISPYTLRVQNVEQPEQALVDWIIRETGTQVWFSEPLGVLRPIARRCAFITRRRCRPSSRTSLIASSPDRLTLRPSACGC